MARFKTRKWSDSDERPYDVVFHDDDGHVYYQPGTTFSSEALAMVHERSLTALASHDSVRRLWSRETIE